MLRIVIAVGLLFCGLPAYSETSIEPTIYDDGESCPGNCDAHVVFTTKLNGTEFAHAVVTPKPPYKKCKAGSLCTICFSSGSDQCMNVMYRGEGPPERRFDFTPRFYEETCPTAQAFPVLFAKCKSMEAEAAKLSSHHNCIQNPEISACKEIMAHAVMRRNEDRPRFEECRKVTEAKYNASKPAADRRDKNCAYEEGSTGGPNTHGVRWQKLLPGSCKVGTYVGLNGLDCCTGQSARDAAFHSECKIFYPLP